MIDYLLSDGRGGFGPRVQSFPYRDMEIINSWLDYSEYVRVTPFAYFPQVPIMVGCSSILAPRS